MFKSKNITFFVALGFAVLIPAIGYCSVESTLMNIQSRLIGTILPIASIIGLVFAGLSFVAGSPNAKGHLTLAIIGAIIGFLAPSLVTFIRSMVN